MVADDDNNKIIIRQIRQKEKVWGKVKDKRETEATLKTMPMLSHRVDFEPRKRCSMYTKMYTKL